MKLKGKIVSLDLDFVSHKPKITIQLTNQESILTEEFNKLQEEELLDIDIVKHREKRSLNANAYFHLLVNKLARVYNRTDEEMKTMLNLSYGTIATDESGKVLGCKVPKGANIKTFYPYAKYYKTDKDNCDCYLFYKQTSTLNTLEFSKLLNGVVQEAKDAGIETLDEIELKQLMASYEASNSKKEV